MAFKILTNKIQILLVPSNNSKYTKRSIACRISKHFRIKLKVSFKIKVIRMLKVFIKTLIIAKLTRIIRIIKIV